MKHARKKTKGEGESNLQSISKGQGATMPPIGWRVGPTMVLVCEINMMLQIALPTVKLHLSAKQFVLILNATATTRQWRQVAS